MRSWIRALLTGVGVALALAPATVRADSVSDFYKGRQMTMILSADAGGGYASYANAFAPYLAAHIPGKPRIVVQYMPGAGGLRAMNYLYSAAPKDGSVVALVHSSVPFAPLYGLNQAKFDPRKINWIGSINATSGICVAWQTSNIKTWNDLFDKQFLVGSSGAGSQMETIPAMLNKLFGTKIKVISGYRGGNEVYLAMERGEVAGRCGGLISSINSTRPDWFAQKKVSVPVQIALERDPQFPDSPAVIEFAKDARTKQILQLVLAPMAMDRPILAPPGVPADRVAALKAAFHAAMADPAFLADAKKQRIEVKEVSGEKVAQLLATAFGMPPDVVKAANEAMGGAAGRGD
ncbi:MAG TPA: tripartite tricarboxylate transporter substrate-binding protein [Micropepsaceae bacterium]|nr:tripartite tricarboxylate transporter substrate-binding protein [Micropepsaceae bacterium]